MKSFQLLGLMSGTSLDGLDIAHVKFDQGENGKWAYKLINSKTERYSDYLIDKLEKATLLSSFQLAILDKELGEFYAEFVNSFLEHFKIQKVHIDAIASHGQTIFHQPEKGITVQIGCGATLAMLTKIPVINDFRKNDIIHGGQGAPLVPIGDFSLFTDKAEAFINIGGFTNISFKEAGKIVAFDICPGNLPLNKLAMTTGLSYDKNGQLAETGEINFFLLELLNDLAFYQNNYPKSLGTEWLEEHFYPLIKFDKDIENNLRTIVEHVAIQISEILKKHELKSVFITGGGALNSFLVTRIKHYFEGIVIIPEKEIIEFKEAIIFAFLGVLFLKDEVNCLSSVTGASKDVVGGRYFKVY
jgi:anhydro-N-acetylmuramic acid kinase